MVLKSSSSLDYWRNYFLTANSDIFNIIDHAILVAASDCPKEFRLRRDRIAEMLFSSLLNRCPGCERIELRVPVDGEEEEDAHRDGKDEFDGDDFEFEFEAGGSKESKVNSSRGDQGELITNQVSNYSYGEAEALTDEIEEESQNFEEVVRIRQILRNKSEESDSVIHDSLRRLQLMALTVDTLKATEIGKAVNGLRRHGSKQISRLAQTLIDEWKELVDDWYRAASDVKVCAEYTPDSNPSMVDDEFGLPSPPMDEAFLATEPSTMELSQFFDGMDDYGNPGEFIKKPASGRKPSMGDQTVLRQKQQIPRELENKLVRRQEPILKPKKPANIKASHERLEKANPEHKSSNETKPQPKTEKAMIQKRPVISQRDILKCSDEMSVQIKLEATKRKLQESYQQVENAKKQRTIQVMELQDLPKRGPGHRSTHVKPGSHNRLRPNGRKS